MMELMSHEPQRYERIDLHTHSTWSDGALTPAELVALAASRQVQLLALTDHDTVAGCPAAAAACAAHRIEFINGCELTSSWRDREIHIVGLGLDIASPVLAAHLSGVQAQRRARIQAIGVKLTKCGLDGEQLSGEVLARAGTPTRAHLARLLVARGHATDVDDAFKRWLARGQRAAVPAQWPAIEATVAAIAAAGGLAVLAHPHRYQTSAGALRELCAQFRDAGGTAIEVSLAGMGPGDASQAASLARRYGLAGSSGSDFHLPGLPWRPLGRLAKLPEGVVPVTERLGQGPVRQALPASHAPQVS
jgi:predicted metal-dependent phosphoesterase TrpH